MKKILLIVILITGLFQLKAQADEAHKYSDLFDSTHQLRLYATQSNEDYIELEGLHIYHDEDSRYFDSGPTFRDSRITTANITDSFNAIQEIIRGCDFDTAPRDGYLVRGVPLQGTGGTDTYLPGNDNQPPGNGTDLRANSTREVENKRVAYPGKVACSRWDHHTDYPGNK